MRETQKLILSTEYKLSLKRKDDDSFTHPSWKRRLEYVSKYNFDESLIHRIADDVDCRNEVLIEEISVYYEPVKLI